MKKIFQFALMAFPVIMVACNDNGGTSDNEAVKTDTIGVVSETTAPAASNVVSKIGLALTSNQEVPANDSKGSGTADVTFNKDTKMFTYTVNYSGLTGDATMAHIHGPAAKGANGGVQHDLTGVLKKSPAGSFTDSVKVDGSSIKEDSLLSGSYYFNIHTAAHPGGEIRAQIEF